MLPFVEALNRVKNTYISKIALKENHVVKMALVIKRRVAISVDNTYN